jgi:hypothetical protein
MTATVEPPHDKNDVTSHEAGAERTPQVGKTTQKDADEWGAGENVMTAAQASYLKTLAEQALEPEAFSVRLTKAEASKRIEALEAKLKLMDGPPHTL